MPLLTDNALPSTTIARDWTLGVASSVITTARRSLPAPPAGAAAADVDPAAGPHASHRGGVQSLQFAATHLDHGLRSRADRNTGPPSGGVPTARAGHQRLKLLIT